MGYTHYFRQTRSFTPQEWSDVQNAMRDLVSHMAKVERVPLNGAERAGRSCPEIGSEAVLFNGVGAKGHETFAVHRIVGEDAGDSCKTEHKPYDLAVTAALAFFATVMKSHHVTSDGSGAEWLPGVEAAKRAWPHHAGVLDIPRPILESDRWCPPHITRYGQYDVGFCVDGRGYLIRLRDNATRAVGTHQDLAQLLHETREAKFSRGGGTAFGSYGRTEPDIWNASGSFDEARVRRLGRAQDRVIAPAFDLPQTPGLQPPPFVRPGEFPPHGGREPCYRYRALLVEKAA